MALRGRLPLPHILKLGWLEAHVKSVAIRRAGALLLAHVELSFMGLDRRRDRAIHFFLLERRLHHAARV